MEESQKHEFDLLSYRILESQGVGTVNCFRCVLCTTSGSLNGEIIACARLHLPRLSSLVFFFFAFSHPSFLCIAVAIFLERPRTVFSIPRQLERVTGRLVIRPEGGERDADGSILMSPCLLGTDVGKASEEGFIHTRRPSCIFIYTTNIHKYN